MQDITFLLEAAKNGTAGAHDRLMELVYDELRALAAARLAGEGNNVTLQPTVLVHEAWLRLGGDKMATWQNRAHFFSAAIEAMRRILIDRARHRKRQRRGEGVRPVSLEHAGEPLMDESPDHFLAVDDALTRFAELDPQKAELVKLRFYVGLTLDEAAEAMGVSRSTASRWWDFSKAWLLRELKSTS